MYFKQILTQIVRSFCYQSNEDVKQKKKSYATLEPHMKIAYVLSLLLVLLLYYFCT